MEIWGTGIHHLVRRSLRMKNVYRNIITEYPGKFEFNFTTKDTMIDTHEYYFYSEKIDLGVFNESLSYRR